MYYIQFDVNVSNGVAIDVGKDVLQVWWMEVYLYVLTNQNHGYMPKLNYFVKYVCNTQLLWFQKVLIVRVSCIKEDIVSVCHNDTSLL